MCNDAPLLTTIQPWISACTLLCYNYTSHVEALSYNYLHRQTVILKVPVKRVTYVCHDPVDTSVFAVIVRAEEGGGLKLHAFQADVKTVSYSHMQSGEIEGGVELSTIYCPVDACTGHE